MIIFSCFNVTYCPMYIYPFFFIHRVFNLEIREPCGMLPKRI